jgi:hypothetical protein
VHQRWRPRRRTRREARPDWYQAINLLIRRISKGKLQPWQPLAAWFKLYVEATSELGSLRTAKGRIPQFNMMRHITDQLLEIAQVEIDNAKLKPQSFVLGYWRRELREAVGPSQRRGDGSCQVGLGGS